MKLGSRVANAKHLLVMKIPAESFTELLPAAIRFTVTSAILEDMYEPIDEFEVSRWVWALPLLSKS